MVTRQTRRGASVESSTADTLRGSVLDLEAGLR